MLDFLFSGQSLGDFYARESGYQTEQMVGVQTTRTVVNSSISESLKKDYCKQTEVWELSVRGAGPILSARTRVKRPQVRSTLTIRSKPVIPRPKIGTILEGTVNGGSSTFSEGRCQGGRIA